MNLKINIRNYFFALPVINVLLDTLTYYFDRGSIIAVIRFGLMLPMILYFLLYRFKMHRTNVFLIFFLGYTLLLVPFSTDLSRSMQGYSKVFISMMMLPISFWAVRDRDDLRKMSIGMVAMAAVMIGYTIIANVYGIGTYHYNDEEETGFSSGLTASKLYVGSFYVVALPIMFPLFKKKWFKTLSIVIGVLLVALLLISVRRTAILIILVGLAVYMFYSSYKLRTYGVVIALLIGLIALFPLYGEILIAKMETRGMDKFSGESLSEEARYRETVAVYNEMLYEDQSILIFGKELFNTPRNYAHGTFGARRMHIDYNIVTYGSGLPGIFLYLATIFALYIYFRKMRSQIPKTRQNQELAAVFLAYLVIFFLVSGIGGMFEITFRSIMFTFLGAILGVYRTEHLKQQAQVEISKVVAGSEPLTIMVR
ncbi:MAG: hypothetical protein ACI9YU_000624 [Flavobacteriales bacterium]|jgi:hypothetical protein